ncbi:hypothetical protein PF003_g1866 [Phytophthora fragariae]|nr:hypothetical protein PF003_g1866 [Phytophthora fragariae]
MASRFAMARRPSPSRAKFANALAANSLMLSVPTRSSPTRGSIAPSFTMTLRLCGLKDKFAKARAASLRLRDRRRFTINGMAPAHITASM